MVLWLNTPNYLDRWTVFGLHSKLGRLITAQHAIEPMPVIHSIILNNQTCSVCLRRKPFQLRCETENCWECRGQFLDLVAVWSLFVAPLLARVIIGLLPLRPERKHIQNAYFGNFNPDDIDWARLDRANGKHSICLFILTKF